MAQRCRYPYYTQPIALSHTDISNYEVVQTVSCSIEVDRKESSGPCGVFSGSCLPLLNNDVGRQVRNMESGSVLGSDSMTKP